MDEAPEPYLNEAIMDMEEHYDLSELCPFYYNLPKNYPILALISNMDTSKKIDVSATHSAHWY